MTAEMAGGRALGGVAAGAGSGAGVPGLLGLLLAMEAGVPIPVPSDLVMLLLGERVSAGALPLWLAALLLERVALAGTAALFLAARGPARALLTRLGRRGSAPTHPDPGEGHAGPPGPGWRGPNREGSRNRQAGRTAVHRVLGRVQRDPGGRGVLPALVTGRTTPGLRTVTVVAAAGSGIRAGRALAALVLGSSLFLQAHLLLGYALGPAARELLERARVPVLVAAGVVLVAVAALVVLRRRRGRVARVLAEGACPACLALGLGVDRGVGRGRAEPTRSGAGSPGGGA